MNRGSVKRDKDQTALYKIRSTGPDRRAASYVVFQHDRTSEKDINTTTT